MKVFEDLWRWRVLRIKRSETTHKPDDAQFALTVNRSHKAEEGVQCCSVCVCVCVCVWGVPLSSDPSGFHIQVQQAVTLSSSACPNMSARGAPDQIEASWFPLLSFDDDVDDRWRGPRFIVCLLPLEWQTAAALDKSCLELKMTWVNHEQIYELFERIVRWKSCHSFKRLVCSVPVCSYWWKAFDSRNCFGDRENNLHNTLINMNKSQLKS